MTINNKDIEYMSLAIAEAKKGYYSSLPNPCVGCVIVILSVILIYNSLICARNSVNEAFSTMDVYLKQRWDLIPNLVECVKSYMEQKLCGISVLTLSEHRTVKQSTIEEFTSIYYPSIFANVERTFSAPIIMAIPYSKNKIAMNSIKKLATVEYQERLSIKTGLAPVQKNCAIPDR